MTLFDNDLLVMQFNKNLGNHNYHALQHTFAWLFSKFSTNFVSVPKHLGNNNLIKEEQNRKKLKSTRVNEATKKFFYFFLKLQLIFLKLKNSRREQNL